MVNKISGLNAAGKTISVKPKKAAEVVQKQEETQQVPVKSCSYENVKAYQTGLNNTLSNNDVRQKYNEVLTNIENRETKVLLNKLLKEGVLLNNDSNNGSTVLDNLHKMFTEPRKEGLDASKVATETLTAIDNPYSISHVIGNIPKKVQQEILNNPKYGVRSEEELQIGNAKHKKTGNFDNDVYKTNTRIAANMEFSLAQRHPAEFARIAEGLSSENLSVVKNIPVSVLADTKEAAFAVLNDFKVPFENGKGNSVNVTVKPDDNAIVRARIQNSSQRDTGERSSVDVLVQSALMNLASNGTYNSLNDRVGHDIAPSEIGFAERILTGRKVTEIILDDVDKSTGEIEHSCNAKTMSDIVLQTLKNGENVICGCLDFNKDSQKYEYNIQNKNNILDTNVYTITNASTDIETGKLKFNFYNPNNNISDKSDELPEKSLFDKDTHMHFVIVPKEIADKFFEY